MPMDALLGGFTHVVPEMPPIGDLNGLRGTAGSAFGEEGGSVAADDLDAGPLGEPGRERVRLPVRQEVDGTTCFDVDEHSSVEGAAMTGSGSEAISLSRVFLLTGTLKASVIRAPARPASASPTDTSADRSRSVLRPNRPMSPGTCSAKVLRGQESSPQTNRRTRSDTTTNLPAVGRSRGNRR